ncbi:pyruvate dehydrogenase complex dihydrolipoyllysine-residue acetyltransferase [Ferrimonas senticii]|uniref:pyruvate dehydrogenase complex dihydrolipoyllysine-residue acetyltransferase n=1 Tax=Ferrimonas senticii TaxID=394566 RepID=UPI0004093487|nr:pyruvate dehydrogenase complex dihydrolipoyllysine-residue acetyltransferase [Ferrimonas senticii]
MAMEIIVPDIGADEVEVTEILVSVGDRVEIDQSLLTVEGDKASMEVPASHAGVVKAIKVAVGDSVATGSLIMLFDTEAAPAAETAPAPVAEAAVPAAAAEQVIVVPDIGGDEVEVTEILVAVGDSISEEQSLLTVEGDKASMEVPAPVAGVVKSIDINVGDSVSTGSAIMLFTVAAGAEASSAAAPEAAPAEAAATTTAAPTQAAAPTPAPVAPTPAPVAAATGEFTENRAYAYATPLIRRLAREFGVDLSKVTGSGRKQRIVKEDVQAYVKAALAKVQSGQIGSNGGGLDLIPWPQVDFAKFGEVEQIPLNKIKRLTGSNLSRNWAMIPHVTQFDEADITEVEAFRKEQNLEVVKKELGFKITPLVFILKAVAKTLADLPQFNASLSADGQSVIRKKYIHVGVAVDTPNGLVVPVIRDVDQKGIYQLSQELLAVSKKARDGKLTAADMQGGCFTISSLGGIGGTAFTPIVNAPEVAILGVSKSEIKPKWNGSEFVPRLMLPLSLSYDHRVIDGADGARFSSTLAAYLSDIRKLTL